jgi:hypothetical protein
MAAQRESLISRVTKLLALANDDGATPAERARAQELADKLMAQHVIERSELTAEEKSKIVQDDWTLPKDAKGGNFRHHVQRLMERVVKHSGCRGTTKYQRTEATGENRYASGDYVYKIVGYPEDIAYAERIWFRVFADFISHLRPEWDESKSLGENVYQHLRAGLTYKRIWELAYEHDMHPENPYEYDDDSRGTGLLRRAYRDYCAEIGEEVKPHTRTHAAYRESYADAYASTVGKRLEDMRDKTKKTIADEGAGDRYALALVDSAAQVEAEFYRLFPEFDPEARRRAQEAARMAERERRDNLTDAERRAEDRRQAEQNAKDERAARRYYGRMRKSQRATFDSAGWAHGSNMGGRVDLSDNKAAGHKKKEVR